MLYNYAIGREGSEGIENFRLRTTDICGWIRSVYQPSTGFFVSGTGEASFR